MGGAIVLTFLASVASCTISDNRPQGAGGGANPGGAATVAGSAGTPSQSGKPTNEGGAPSDGGMSDGGMSNGGDAGTSPGPATPQPSGFSCKEDDECTSAHCVDGVCCETSCGGCNACANTLTGQNNGICAPVLVGKDPHDACADETASNECGTDGTCNGAGACAMVAASHVCDDAGCTADGKSFLPASTCSSNGNGTCTGVAPENCAGYPCSAAGCAKECTTSADCASTSYCDPSSKKCSALKTDGSTAVQSYECRSGFVADGVCCNVACTGKCQSCAQTAGTCKPVVTPRSSCGGSGTCGAMKCDGTHPDCVYPGNEVACPTTCSGDLTAKLSSTCNGSGACGVAQSVGCGSSQYCSGGNCTAKLGNGKPNCSSAVTCTSGNCSASPTGGNMCCASGQANCSQGCYDLKSDAKHCGTCDGDCGPNHACKTSVCQCSGPKLQCGKCASWDFDSGTTEGWVNAFYSTTTVVTPTNKPTPGSPPFGGSSSLAFDVDLAAYTSVAVLVPLCANAGISTDVAGLSFYIYADGPAYPGFKDQGLTLDENGGQNGSTGVGLESKTWVKASNTFNATASYVGFQLLPNADWKGTIYIDQVLVTPN